MSHNKQKYFGKISKGLVMLILVKITFFGSFAFIQSCKKTESSRSDGKAKIRFYDAINKNKATINAITANKLNNGNLNYEANSETNSSISSENESLEEIYLQPPVGGGGNFENLPGSLSIQQISHLVHNYNAVVQYTPSSTNHGFNIPINEVTSSLNPLLTEARAYLVTKGFTNEELNQMIIDSGAVETDLIPFAMVLASNEPPATTKINYSQFFGQSAYAGDVTWGDFFSCGLAAIGLQFASAASPSMTGSWSKASMKKAFGAIAKRFLGPVGVAIAVVTFGLCIADAYLE